MSSDIQKACESLALICRRFLEDNYLSNDEILFLRQWLASNTHLIGEWPGDIVYKRIERVLEDGYIEPDERDYLTETLELVISGELMRSAGQASELLPLDHVEQVELDNKVFCFAGEFVYGSKLACQRATISAGAFAIKRPSNQLNFLVIGGRTGAQWRATDAGNHVDMVKGFRKTGMSMGIISEDCWSRSLPVASLLWSG